MAFLDGTVETAVTLIPGELLFDPFLEAHP
jgi:hypothetical protein